MKIAILSGKGGTGKTFVSVNLAAVSEHSTYLDCDVEEPNGYLFFKPQNIIKEDVNVLIPNANYEKCNGCRSCIDFCKFNALALINKKLKVFSEVCHSCGGCTIVCPTGAIEEVPKCIGIIEKGIYKNIRLITGKLHLGESSGVPVIKRVLEYADKDNLTIIDCPPGSACSVLESLSTADYCILVAEPTTFGLHNFLMVYQLAVLLKKPCGVIINKALDTENIIHSICNEKNIPVIASILYDDRMAKLTSTGRIACEYDENWHDLFQNILHKITMEVTQ